MTFTRNQILKELSKKFALIFMATFFMYSCGVAENEKSQTSSLPDQNASFEKAIQGPDGQFLRLKASCREVVDHIPTDPFTTFAKRQTDESVALRINDYYSTCSKAMNLHAQFSDQETLLLDLQTDGPADCVCRYSFEVFELALPEELPTESFEAGWGLKLLSDGQEYNLEEIPIRYIQEM